MYFKYWKLLFYTILLMSIIITVSTFSWLNMWIGLEINMLSIIPLMNSTKNMFMTESSLKYFIVQAMASSLLLLGIILMSFNMSYKITMLMDSAILIKIGSAPFHFWFPEIMEGQMWTMAFNLLTIQKISPFMLLNYNMNAPLFLLIIIILNMMISALMGLNQISLRKILTFSSINHIGWMIAAIMFMKTIWMMYFVVYIIILGNLIYMLNYFNIYYIKQLMKISLPINFKLMFIMNFFSMGGLPPFIGFLPKWLTIQTLINNKFIFLMSAMVILTLFTLYYYTRIMISSLMFMKSFNLYNMSMNNFIIYTNFINMISLPVIFLIFIN